MTDAGLGLVAISYDPVDTLKGFADKHGITFPLLSDAGSQTITAWGLINRDATGRTAGIPHPGTFVIAPNGRVSSLEKFRYAAIGGLAVVTAVIVPLFLSAVAK